MTIGYRHTANKLTIIFFFKKTCFFIQAEIQLFAKRFSGYLVSYTLDKLDRKIGSFQQENNL